jgi:membrane-associated phospholipid phosphatase
VNRVIVLAAALLAALAVAPAGYPKAQQSAAEPWIRFELDAIASQRLNPPRASRALALVSRAIFEASEAGEADRDSAVAGAASTMLAYLFPSEAARVVELAGPAVAESRHGAFAAGVLIASRLIDRAETDGSSAAWTGAPPVVPGSWVPTPPAFGVPPLEPLAGTWRTWNLKSGSEFRPAAPPAFGTARFLDELAEVYTVSRSLTAEQKAIASFWADGAGTVTPPGHWNVIALQLLDEVGFGTRRAARLFAALNTAQADAFIACWDAKFAYWSQRPVTAIRSLYDPAWSSFIPTPPFPSYVSGHSTTSAAASTVLARFFPSRSADLSRLAAEAAVSRLYGGIHYRSDNEAGLVLGRRVGAAALVAYGREND